MRLLENHWYSKLLLFFVTILSLSSCNEQTEKKDQILWYDKPAETWEQSLPLGNGRIGVMVFGDPKHERIQLNDDSMWPGEAGWAEPDGTRKDLNEIRQMLVNGDNLKADTTLVNKFSRKWICRSHQTMGDLFIDWDHDSITDYKRELNISNATSLVTYKADGNLVTQQIFTSHPDEAIVMQFSSESVSGLNGKIKMSRPMDNDSVTAICKAENGLLKLIGEVTQQSGFFGTDSFPINEGVRFETWLKIEHEGGELVPGDGFMELRNVKTATFYMVANSSFYYNNFAEQNKIDLLAVEGKSYSELEEKHIHDYQSLFNRVTLKLEGPNYDYLPINERINRIKDGELDLGLESMLFDYGRYLLIGCSRPGTNPANLQGLWNEHITAPWNGDYHLNINLQMNYWLANVTNLDELNEPLFDYVDRLVENGKVTARKNFGCEGSFIPHATDLWAPTFLRAPTAYWGCSFGAGGWMMQHYWEHFMFTNDTVFLKERAVPALEQVARFYSDWVIEDPRDGTLVSAPSTSPENQFILPNGVQVASCLGSAMDQQVIAEVFRNYLKACEILGVKSDFISKVKKQQIKLRPGFVLSSEGRILEWDREYKESEPGHRHMSQLYGFHPGTEVTKSEHPELFDAVRKTLNYRLEHGGAGTGWSRAWLINCSARLLDGDMAHEHIQLLFSRSMFDNLFDAHPPFQIDGNFGYTAGVAEMLVQSHEPGLIRILPALPTEWHAGWVKGLRARGAITVDIKWTDNKLTKVVLLSESDQNINLNYNEELVPIELEAGEPFEYIAIQ